jgi:anti-sigma factor RsiW
MMKMHYIVSAVFAVLAVCTAAVYASDPQKGTLTVTVTPGAYWKTERGPQFAVWVEKGDGTYVTTLFVTQRAAKQNWLFAPKDGRPESLPVWYHAVDSRPVTVTALQDKTNTDAVTSATPGAAGAIRYPVRLPSGERYVVKIEVNHSFDYNESWPKKAQKGSSLYSGVNGQPSVVYECTLDTTVSVKGNGRIQAVLVPAGTGSVTGRDGKIHDDLAGLTTALQIIGKAEASWNSAE